MKETDRRRVIRTTGTTPPTCLIPASGSGNDSMHLSELRISLAAVSRRYRWPAAALFSDAVFVLLGTHSHTQHIHRVHSTTKYTTPCLGTGVQLQFCHSTFHVVISHKKKKKAILSAQTDNRSRRCRVSFFFYRCVLLTVVYPFPFRDSSAAYCVGLADACKGQSNMKSPRAAASSRLFLPTYVCNMGA